MQHWVNKGSEQKNAKKYFENTWRRMDGSIIKTTEGRMRNVLNKIKTSITIRQIYFENPKFWPFVKGYPLWQMIEMTKFRKMSTGNKSTRPAKKTKDKTEMQDKLEETTQGKTNNQDNVA